MIHTYYPKASTKEHYVFLNTLETDNFGLYSAAKAMVALNTNLEDDPQLVLKEGIDFLRKAAESERNKEKAFLNQHGIELRNGNDYGELIEQINKAKIGLDEFQRRVREEKNRRNVKGIGGWSFTQGLSGYISAAKNQISGAKGSKRMNTISGVVRSALIKQFKSLGGSMTLDQLASVIGMTQSLIMSEITEQVSDIDTNDILPDFFNKDGKTISQKKIENLIKKTEAYKRYIEEPKKNLPILQEYSKNILSKYGYGFSKPAREALKKAAGTDKNGKVNLARKLTKDGKDVGIDWGKVAEQAQKSSSLTEALESIAPEKRYEINITGNTGMGGESRIYNDIQHFIERGISSSGSWVGGAGGKIDLFEVEITENIPNISSAIEDIESLITTETQNQFNRVGGQFSNYYQELDDTLEEARKEQDELSKSFITHYNVKDAVTTNDSGFSGFKSGDYKGFNFIEGIAALQDAGFSSADIDFLKTCFVNTANEAVGASNKEGLEKYFSLFATMMLFDDGRTIAEQAAGNLTLNSLDVLHIFPLNGIYVPSSVVMTMVADELEKMATIEAAKVSITTGDVNFTEELNKLSQERTYNYHRWEAIREKQIAAMTTRIRILANFSALIDMLG